VGFYDEQTGQRLRALDPAGAPLPGDRLLLDPVIKVRP
jgi:hypothetical protein